MTVADKTERLWVVSELYYPEQTSTGYFLTRIAEGLAGDFDVRVVAGQPSYSERGLRAPARENRNGTLIHRLRATHFDKDRLLLRAVNVLSFTVAMLWFTLVRFRAGDRILVVTNPPTVPIVVALAARLRGCRAYLLVHDVYPELLAATGMLRRESLGYRLLAKLFSWTYRRFDGIVVLGRDMARLAAAKIGGDDTRIRIIPNWADADEVFPIPPKENRFREEHGLQGRFVVQFSGNIGRSHDVGLVLGAAHILRDQPGIVFLFVGYGGKAALAAGAAAGQTNVRFLPRQPRERLCEMLAASDVTVIPFVENMLGISVPSRMYNVMAAGVPIVAVAEPLSELCLTVESRPAGWTLHRPDAGQLAELIRSLATPAGRDEARRRGGAGRDMVVAAYTFDHVLAAYRNLLGENMETSRRP